MKKIELVSSVLSSRDGYTEDIKLKTLLILKFWQKSPEKFFHIAINTQIFMQECTQQTLVVF